MNRSIPKDHHWWQRATLGALLMIGANLVPLWLTWGDWQTDGATCVGWPFAFWAFGGIGGATTMSLRMLLLDAAIVLLASRIIADMTAGGFAVTIHRLRTWPRRD